MRELGATRLIPDTREPVTCGFCILTDRLRCTPADHTSGVVFRIFRAGAKRDEQPKKQLLRRSVEINARRFRSEFNGNICLPEAKAEGPMSRTRLCGGCLLLVSRELKRCRHQRIGFEVIIVGCES